MYVMNKRINRPAEFRGLKAQYIWMLGGSFVSVLLVFGVMYALGISTYICMPLALGLGGFGLSRVSRMSRKYGQYGLMKLGARKKTPWGLQSRSRRFLIQLMSDHVRTIR
jgi:hypothetical protein